MSGPRMTASPLPRGGVGEGAGWGDGLNYHMVWVSLSTLVLESHWVGMLLSIHLDTAGEGKVEMIHLGKEEKIQSKQTKHSLQIC